MNQETLEALSKLANKLGTTSEYLWSVLLKQAPIYAATTALSLTLWVLATAVAAYFYLKNYKDASEEFNVIAGMSLGTVTLLTLVFASADIPSIISALANPEYWALKQIIK